jgi:hypothetical protein
MTTTADTLMEARQVRALQEAAKGNEKLAREFGLDADRAKAVKLKALKPQTNR